MSAAHWHLLLNHLPVLGLALGVGWLAVAVGQRSRHWERLGLETLVVVAILTIPTYLTGKPAAAFIQPLDGAAQALIDRHEETAQLASAATLLLGLLALAGRLGFHRAQAFHPWFTLTVLTLGLIAVGLMAWTANLGGQVRHPEIRSTSFQGKP
ncbi:MAG: hypothetical protein KGS61_00045 [Verrucomicrobia bacterium]|nr:hypothetical protein [Verrucomicrobiota bacterium]